MEFVIITGGEGGLEWSPRFEQEFPVRGRAKLRGKNLTRQEKMPLKCPAACCSRGSAGQPTPTSIALSGLLLTYQRASWSETTTFTMPAKSTLSETLLMRKTGLGSPEIDT